MDEQISIGIDQEDKYYLLTGSVGALLKKRRAKMFLNGYLSASTSENQIMVPFEEESKEETLQKLRDLLKKFGFVEETSQEIEDLLSNYFQEEKNFSEFSKQAYHIRNDELDETHLKDFKEFTDVLLAQLPKRRLYPLQLLSAYHLAFSQNGCNFSVPGSGKTSIVYGAYGYLRRLDDTDSRKVDKLVIIGPLSSFGPWEDEYEECFGESANSKRLSGGVPKEERVRHFYSSTPDEISLISYNGVPNMLDDLIFFLRKHRCMVVLDEAHKIKNTEGGLFAASTLKLAKFAKSRVVLTGTPAPNGYEDIFNLFKFIWPSHDIVGFHLYQLKDMSSNPGDHRINKLVDNLSPYFIRIRKSDLNLPEPVNHPPIYVEMDELQTEIYEYIEKSYMDYFISHGNESNLHGLLTRARLIRLMQVSTNPALLQKSLDEYFVDQGISNNTFIDDADILQKIINYREFEIPKKFIVAGELIKEIISKNEKVIVWATFIQNLYEFSEYLEKLNIKSRLLYGATPIETDIDDESVGTREKIIREFHNKNCPYKVLIANPFAVSESISLHKACQNAIYLERTFNAANFIQSKDRIHRVGLEKTVNYYYILSNNNVDSTIHKRLYEKEKRMLEIIEHEPIPLFNKILDDDDDFKVLINNYVQQSTKA